MSEYPHDQLRVDDPLDSLFGRQFTLLRTYGPGMIRYATYQMGPAEMEFMAKAEPNGYARQIQAIVRLLQAELDDE